MYVSMYVSIYTLNHSTTGVHFFWGTKMCKECGGWSMREHKVLPVSEPRSLPLSPAKKKNALKARNCAASVFLFIYSFCIGKEVCRVCLKAS